MNAQTNTTSGAERSAKLSLKHFKLSLAALIVSAAFILMMLSPAVMPVQAWDWKDAAVVVGSAEAGMAIGSALGDGIGCIIGTGVGALAGFIIASIGSHSGPAYGAQAIASYAGNLKNVTQSYLDFSHTNAANIKNTMPESQYFFARKAEWAAKQLYDYQTAHDLAHLYDAQYVLSKSEVGNATATYVWGVAENYNSVFTNYADLSQFFVGDYDGMEWGIASGYSGSYTGYWSSPINEPYRLIKFTTCLDTIGSAVLYIPAQYNLTCVVYTPGDYTLTVKNGTGDVVVTKEISGAVAGEMFTFQLSDYGLPSGAYTLSRGYHGNPDYTYDYRWFGYAANAPTNSGTVEPAMLTLTKSDAAAIVQQSWIWATSGEVQVGKNAEAHAQVIRIAFNENWLGNSCPVKHYVTPDQIVIDIRNILTQTASTLSTANGFGQSYYNFLVAHGGQGNPPMPDIIFPDPTQMENLTWEQIYAIYLAYMNSLQSWFYNYSYMDTNNLTLSLQSMDLLCRGSIYNETGVEQYNNTTVWTPYISTTNMTLVLGNNTFEQPGFFVLWGNTTDLSLGLQTQSVSYVPFIANWSADIEQIYFKNESVETTPLNVTTLILIVGPAAAVVTPPQGITDMQWLIDHWYLIAGVLGVVLLLAAIAVRRWEIMVIGLILIGAAVFGYYESGGLTGLFGLWLGG